jgi:anionic cell wall polymer biosynthesis LytR-Cps2A-Psr (LCP) family protein
LIGPVKLIDQLGGVDLVVTNPVMDDFYPSDLNSDASPYDYYRVAVLLGAVHLNGVQALQYVRSRHGDLRGDFARSERQQQLLLAIKAQASHLNIADLPTLASAFNGRSRPASGWIACASCSKLQMPLAAQGCIESSSSCLPTHLKR